MAALTTKEIAADITKEARLVDGTTQTAVDFIVTKTIERLAYEVFSGNLSGVGKLLETFDPAKPNPQPV